MALAVKRDARRSVAECRRWQEPWPDEERREPLDGERVVTPPPRERHRAIVTNLIRRPGDRAGGMGRRARAGLAILSDAIDDPAPVPTVGLRRGPTRPEGCATDPRVAAEILSTTSPDRGRTIDLCRTGPPPELDGGGPVRDISRGLAL